MKKPKMALDEIALIVLVVLFFVYGLCVFLTRAMAAPSKVSALTDSTITHELANREAQPVFVPQQMSKRRAVQPPSPYLEYLPVHITHFPMADDGRVFKVKCNGIEKDCKVARGQCIAQLYVFPAVEYSCSWGYAFNGKGGVAFIVRRITIK